MDITGDHHANGINQIKKYVTCVPLYLSLRYIKSYTDDISMTQK